MNSFISQPQTTNIGRIMTGNTHAFIELEQAARRSVLLSNAVQWVPT